MYTVQFRDLPIFQRRHCIDADTTSTISFYGVWLQIIIMMPCQKCNTLSSIRRRRLSTSSMRIRGGPIDTYTDAYRLECKPWNSTTHFWNLCIAFSINSRHYLHMDLRDCQCENSLCFRNGNNSNGVCTLYIVQYIRTFYSLTKNPQNQIKSSIMISYEIRAIAMLFRLFYVLFNATWTNLAESKINLSVHIYTRRARTHILINLITQTGQYGILCVCAIVAGGFHYEAVLVVVWLLVLQMLFHRNDCAVVLKFPLKPSSFLLRNFSI